MSSSTANNSRPSKKKKNRVGTQGSRFSKDLVKRLELGMAEPTQQRPVLVETDHPYISS